MGGVLGWWCRPIDAPHDAAILYFHGGAYVVGSARAYQHFVGQVAVRARVSAFVPEYSLGRSIRSRRRSRMHMLLSSFAGLVEHGFGRIVLAGDSAGGGLALSLLSLVAAEAREGTRVRPAGAAVMSPWTDLALSGASMETRAKVDPLRTKESLVAAARIYLSEHDPFDPRASPLYADLAGLPPVRIHVGEDEVLLDDSIRYGERLETAGGTVQVHTWEGMIHVFPSNIANPAGC